MFASSSIGNVKLTQEDSVLLSEYPKNKDYKMLLVADGVGGSQNGGAASSYVAEEMLEWFKGLKKEDFENMDMLRAKLSQKIQEMNRETNTIGSKANNLNITNGVIEIKTQIENIREQVQNIE